MTTTPTIRTRAEYQTAIEQIADARRRIEQYLLDWKSRGYRPEDIAALREPLEAELRRMEHEVERYLQSTAQQTAE